MCGHQRKLLARHMPPLPDDRSEMSPVERSYIFCRSCSSQPKLSPLIVALRNYTAGDGRLTSFFDEGTRTRILVVRSQRLYVRRLWLRCSGKWAEVSLRLKTKTLRILNLTILALKLAAPINLEKNQILFFAMIWNCLVNAQSLCVPWNDVLAMIDRLPSSPA